MPTGLTPLGGADARILLLGTMPSVQSLQRQEYYGNPQNAFWKLLYTLWGEAWEPDYAVRTRFITRQKLILWDVLAACERQGSADATITGAVPNDFATFAQSHPDLRAVFFNSMGAAHFYKRLVMPDPLAHLPQITLPSSSPARAMRFDDKLTAWRPLKNAWDVAIREK